MILGRKKAIIGNPRLDMCSRQVFMYEDFKNLVEINKMNETAFMAPKKSQIFL